MPAEYAVSIASKLLSDPTVNPTGLGARDSLRLEAGLCLYGHDLNETINPVEATLAWTMGGPKSRRRQEGGFLGAEHILTPDGGLQKVAKKRVGLMGMKAPAREGAEIFDAAGEKKIGEVTSGTFSPCLKGKCPWPSTLYLVYVPPSVAGINSRNCILSTFTVPIAMGYVETPLSKKGTEVNIQIRGKMQKAEITAMPFVESRYYRVPE